MDWGDALFCVIAAILAVAVFSVSMRVRQLTDEARKLRQAVEQFSDKPR